MNRICRWLGANCGDCEDRAEIPDCIDCGGCTDIEGGECQGCCEKEKDECQH